MCILLHAIATRISTSLSQLHISVPFLLHLLLPFFFMCHLPAVLILPCCFFTLLFVLLPSLLSQFPFPGFHSGSPSPRSSLGAMKGSRWPTESLLATRMKGNLLSYLTPPASPAKPLPPEPPPFRPKGTGQKEEGL